MADSPAAAAMPAGAQFGVGAVLGRAFSIYGSRFGVFLLLGLVTLSPLLLFGLYGIFVRYPGLPAAPGAFGAMQWLTALGTILLSMIFNVICQATILFGTFQVMLGRGFSFGESMGVGLRRALPVIGVSIVAAICWSLASVLLIVPGIIVFCMLYVAVPACVIERAGVFASLDRSSKLTKGYRWKIFAIVLVFYVISGVGSGLIGVALRHVLPGSNLAVLSEIISFLWQAAATALGAVFAAVAYHDLRVAKEGVDTEKIAAVFA